MRNYEIRLLDVRGRLATAIFTSSDSDAHAMLAIKKIHALPYHIIEVWRELDRIYVGLKPSYAV